MVCFVEEAKTPETVLQYNGNNDDRVVRLLKAHIFGSNPKYTDFAHALRCKIVEIAIEMQASITYATIYFAFRNTHEPCLLRRFVYNFYALIRCPESLEDPVQVSRLISVDTANSFIKKSKPSSKTDNAKSMTASESYVQPSDNEVKSQGTHRLGYSRGRYTHPVLFATRTT